jgi:SAM-dependent methyltransferase
MFEAHKDLTQTTADRADTAQPEAARPGKAGVPARASALHAVPAVPDYLRETYTWAYLRPLSLVIFDHPAVVSAILWGHAGRLERALLDELRPGQRVLQPACVYGDLSPRIAAFLGPGGRLDVADVAPVQAENCRLKLREFPNATVALFDAAEPRPPVYDAVCSFFLLHEMPDDYRTRVVNALLGAVRPGGKAVFIDYHKPHRAHPLKWLTGLVFDLLEPFAKGLWSHEISDYAQTRDGFTWSTTTYFGGLFQKTVARRNRP